MMLKRRKGEVMDTGGQPIRARPRLRARTGGAALLALLLALAVGCSSAPAKPKSKVTSCGTARTAANVPIRVEVTSGSVSCATALSVERKYAEAIRSGLAPGNGGGGPVKVNGWTCQGYATPVVLRTGKASRCVKDGTQILAILPTSA
jgi:hypothetical protein